LTSGSTTNVIRVPVRETGTALRIGQKGEAGKSIPGGIIYADYCARLRIIPSRQSVKREKASDKVTCATSLLLNQRCR